MNREQHIQEALKQKAKKLKIGRQAVKHMAYGYSRKIGCPKRLVNRGTL